MIDSDSTHITSQCELCRDSTRMRTGMTRDIQQAVTILHAYDVAPD